MGTSPAQAVAANNACGLTLDEEQADLTSRGKELLAYVAAKNGGSTAAIEQGIAAFESRFRTRGNDGWRRKALQSATELRLPGEGDAAFIQAVADYNALWFGTLDAPAGFFELDDAVFVTHGLASPWSTGRLVGAGVNFDGSVNFRGTTLNATRSDRPALICQGGRKDLISDLTVRGPLRDHIMRLGLGTTNSAVDDTDPRTWDFGSIGDRRWAPLAGIAVDPYADGLPPVAYPRIVAPPYLGSPNQYYGREVTSDVLIRRVIVTGFNVGLVVHPAPGVSQGDYVHAEDLMIEACKYGVSVGNSQSRLATAVHRHIARVFCGFTNHRHGAQQGFFGGTEMNAEVGGCIKVFDFDLGSLGKFTFDGLYSESCWQIGDVRGSTAVDGIVVIRGSHLDLTYSGAAPAIRGVPRYIIGDATNPTGYEGSGQVALQDTEIKVRTACALMVKNLSLERVTIYPAPAVVAAEDLPRALAHNGSMGLMMPPGARPTPAIVTCPRFDLTSLEGGHSHTTDENFRETGRRWGIPWFLTKARPGTHTDDRYAVSVPLWQFAVNASEFGVVSQSGLEVHLRQAGNRDAAANQAQSPGCLVLHSKDGRWYYVKRRDDASGVMILTALGDYNDRGSGDTLRTPFRASGALHFIETRFYTPSDVLLGDTTAGSNRIVNLRSAAGRGVDDLAEIAAGDYIWRDPHDAAPMFTDDAAGGFQAARNRVLAVDFSAATIIMSGNAERSQRGYRIGLMIRGT